MQCSNNKSKNKNFSKSPINFFDKNYRIEQNFFKPLIFKKHNHTHTYFLKDILKSLDIVQKIIF